MWTLVLTLAVLAIYGLVTAYGFHDVFVAHRNRGEADEPILAAWHFFVAVVSLLAAGAMILGGLLVAFGGSQSLAGWWESPVLAGRILLNIVVGGLSIVLGFMMVRYTRVWLAPNIGKPQIRRRVRGRGGPHHAR